MKKHSIPLLALLVALSSGCAHQYVMRLTNGERIVANNKPQLKGSVYYFKAGGQERRIPQSRVLEVEPASMAREEDKSHQFVPAKPPHKHWYWPF